MPALTQFDQGDKDQQFTAVGYGGQEALNQPGGTAIGDLHTESAREFLSQYVAVP